MYAFGENSFMTCHYFTNQSYD